MLLVLSVLRVGSLEAMFAFLAAVSVLCSLPGAKGVAISARRAKVYAVVAAILAVHSCVVPMAALVHGIPMEAVDEVQLRCESMDPGTPRSPSRSSAGPATPPRRGTSASTRRTTPSLMVPSATTPTATTSPTTSASSVQRPPHAAPSCLGASSKPARTKSAPAYCSPRVAPLGRVRSQPGACKGPSARRDAAVDTCYSTHSRHANAR